MQSISEIIKYLHGSLHPLICSRLPFTVPTLLVSLHGSPKQLENDTDCDLFCFAGTSPSVKNLVTHVEESVKTNVVPMLN